jgi:hypothetical protein
MDAVDNTIDKSIAVAQEQGRFLTESEMEHIIGILREENDRFAIVNSLAANSSHIIQLTIDKITRENIHTEAEVNLCLQDGEAILRYITYSVICGSASVLEEHYLDQLIEKYLALGVSSDQVRRAVGTIKNVVINLLDDHISQINPKANQIDYSILMDQVADYFDLIIDEFTWESKFAATTEKQWERMLEAARQDIDIHGTTPLEEVFPPGT